MREERFGGITVRLVGGEDRQGGGDGPLVVLMHGFGAPGTDLVGLWRVIDVPQTVRFAFPEAPEEIPGMFGARAWWMIDLDREMPRNYANEVPPGMEAATEAVAGMIRELQNALNVSSASLVVGGFSQGSMAACDVVFTHGVDAAGLVVMSGTPIHFASWKQGMAARADLSVFQSHGVADPLLPFEAAEQLRDAMIATHLDVQWVPFRGGHEVPMPVLEGLSSFLRRFVPDATTGG